MKNEWTAEIERLKTENEKLKRTIKIIIGAILKLREGMKEGG